MMCHKGALGKTIVSDIVASRAVKICGVSNAKILKRCIDLKINFVGFVFHSASSRFLSFEDAKVLIEDFNYENVGSVTRFVALFVNPSDEDIQCAVDIGMHAIQLHGGESPERVKVIKNISNLLVIKAFGVSSVHDFECVNDYVHADMFILDAKTDDKDMPGGKGVSFDWKILSSRRFNKKWLVSGGLNVDNVSRAYEVCKHLPNFAGFDVSSGVEVHKGIKDAKKIDSFVKVVNLL